MPQILDALAVEFGFNTDAFQAAARRSEQELEEEKAKLRASGAQLEELTKNFLNQTEKFVTQTMKSFGLILSFEGFRKLVVDSSRAATEIGNLARVTGASVTEIDQLSLAFTTMGGSPQVFLGIFDQMTRDIINMSQAGPAQVGMQPGWMSAIQNIFLSYGLRVNFHPNMQPGEAAAEGLRAIKQASDISARLLKEGKASRDELYTKWKQIFPELSPAEVNMLLEGSKSWEKIGKLFEGRSPENVAAGLEWTKSLALLQGAMEKLWAQLSTLLLPMKGAFDLLTSLLTVTNKVLDFFIAVQAIVGGILDKLAKLSGVGFMGKLMRYGFKRSRGEAKATTPWGALKEALAEPDEEEHPSQTSPVFRHPEASSASAPIPPAAQPVSPPAAGPSAAAPATSPAAPSSAPTPSAPEAAPAPAAPANAPGTPPTTPGGFNDPLSIPEAAPTSKPAAPTTTPAAPPISPGRTYDIPDIPFGAVGGAEAVKRIKAAGIKMPPDVEATIAAGNKPTKAQLDKIPDADLDKIGTALGKPIYSKPATKPAPAAPASTPTTKPAASSTSGGTSDDAAGYFGGGKYDFTTGKRTPAAPAPATPPAAAQPGYLERFKKWMHGSGLSGSDIKPAAFAEHKDFAVPNFNMGAASAPAIHDLPVNNVDNTSTHIQSLVVNTQATDAVSIAADIHGAIRNEKKQSKQLLTDFYGPASTARRDQLPPSLQKDLSANTLRRGDAGERVQLAQSKLGPKISGQFDATTEDSVKRFQGLTGLQRTGVADPDISRRLQDRLSEDVIP